MLLCTGFNWLKRGTGTTGNSVTMAVYYSGSIIGGKYLDQLSISFSIKTVLLTLLVTKGNYTLLSGKKFFGICPKGLPENAKYSFGNKPRTFRIEFRPIIAWANP